MIQSRWIYQIRRNYWHSCTIGRQAGGQARGWFKLTHPSSKLVCFLTYYQIYFVLVGTIKDVRILFFSALTWQRLKLQSNHVTYFKCRLHCSLLYHFALYTCRWTLHCTAYIVLIDFPMSIICACLLSIIPVRSYQGLCSKSMLSSRFTNMFRENITWGDLH